jgi:uncharacterized protein
MRPAVRAVTLGVAAAAVVPFAAFAAAPVHSLMASAGWDESFLRVFRRLLLFPLALIALFALRPWREGGLRSYGLVGPDARLGPGLVGAALTLAAGVAILAFHLSQGWLEWTRPTPWGSFAGRVARYVVSGLVIGFLEEWFFRGWMTRWLGRGIPFLLGVVVSAAFFAVLHAFHPSSLDADTTPDAAGALAALGTWIRRAFDPVEFGPKFVGLFLFALLLTATWLRTRTLWTPVLVHMAAIILIASYGAVTDRSPARTWAGTKVLYDGPPAWALFLLAIALVWPRSRKVPGTDFNDS